MDEQNSRIQEILAKDEIREVIYRVARGTDRRDAELIRSGYHPDAIDDHGFLRLGPDEFAEWMAKQIGITEHFFGQINIEVKGDVAYSEAYCQGHVIFPATGDLEERDLFHGMRYLDRFEKREGGLWLIAYRFLVYDWMYYIPAGAKLTAPDTVVWAKLDRQDPSWHMEDFPSTKEPWEKIYPPPMVKGTRGLSGA